jgi:hypothetical protein
MLDDHRSKTDRYDTPKTSTVPSIESSLRVASQGQDRSDSCSFRCVEGSVDVVHCHFGANEMHQHGQPQLFLQVLARLDGFGPGGGSETSWFGVVVSAVW